METNKSNRYINPYLGGFLLGIVLLTTYYIDGHGLGASGAIKNFVIHITNAVNPEFAKTHHFFSQKAGESLFSNWVVVMFFGILVGGFVSGAASNRLKFQIDKGPRISNAARLFFAFLGGALFGIGAQLGKGCTSGAALSGMAVLSTSGIITMMAIFGTGFAIAFIFRKLWL